MCGIVGMVAQRDVVATLIQGLTHLEYRGYDSAGIAVLNQQHMLERVRAVGRVANISDQTTQLQGKMGIGHTRWATHGGVTEANAHPHISHGDIALVHNGIIENHEEKQAYLQSLGYSFTSQTDTEVIAHLIHHHYQSTHSLLLATQQAISQLKGAYAIAVIARYEPETLVVARQGCPLLIGVGEQAHWVASDVSAVLAQTRHIIYLEDGDTACLTPTHLQVYDRQAQAVIRPQHISSASLATLELGPYTHFMQKEIHEQPRALADTLEALIDNNSFSPTLFGDDEIQANLLSNINGVLIVAAGTSYYAGLTAKYWIEQIAGVATQVEIASEYRYRSSVPNPQQLVVAISQSGETLDTLEALKHAQMLGHTRTLAICNVQESTIARTASRVFYTRAGSEIGVASTKAFTTQLITLFMLACTLAKHRQRLSQTDEQIYLHDCRELTHAVQETLGIEAQIRRWAKDFIGKQHALFLGRNLHYPIALEGALKLKEISYIHAEAYPAGELKHGPLALIDNNMPVIVLAPQNVLLDKIKANAQEIRARGGELYVLTDSTDFAADNCIILPRHIASLSPILYSIPVQLLAYHCALLKGTDVDKPRNLAKSVTVE